MRARFLIGIDLGTTNSSLAYIDSLESEISSITLPCPQWQAPHVRGDETVLPSFLYFASPVDTLPSLFEDALSEDSKNSDNISPVSSIILGRYAESRMSETPGRVVQSAKSWLCHRGADPEEAILPWGSNEIEPENKLSPVQVSAYYLSHFKNAWNASIGKHSEDYLFENQDITITVPASFDAVAQRLTLRAAELAGYPAVHLLEEPQAAFYHWLEVNSDSEQLQKIRELQSATVLVCDIGGGTTDFSLFEIKGQNSSYIARLAVSDHILLGGDNIDVTIARYIESKLLNDDVKLGIKQWNYLLYRSRKLKESLLADDAKNQEVIHIALPSEGSSLFAKSIGVDLTKSELETIIIDGFFPVCSKDATLDNSSSGLREWGLPFAKDSAVSRHLIGFLRGATSLRHSGMVEKDATLLKPKAIDAVLYTGGTLTSPRLRKRLTSLIASWQDSVEVIELNNQAMELGVARGAAYYGAMRRSPSNLIKAGYSHSIYLELAKHRASEEEKLICMLPHGTQPGNSVSLDHLVFEALVDRPVCFKTYYSTKRHDEPGSIVNLDSDVFRDLPSLQTKLQLTDLGKKSVAKHIKVTLRSEITELGLLQLYCVHETETGEIKNWQLDFNLRRGGESLSQTHSNESSDLLSSTQIEIKKAEEIILVYYGKEKHKQTKSEITSVKNLIRDLESVFKESRKKWNIVTLRNIWEPLSQGITRRNRSLAHETAWLTLAGWCLRPGFGADLDNHRIDQLWRVFHLGLSFAKERSAQLQWWIMWRRVAGGLDKQQQEVLYSAIHPLMQKKGIEDPELINLAASLERISIQKKIDLASRLLNQISSGHSPQRRQMIWALERIGARALLYAGYEAIVPSENVKHWFDKLEVSDWTEPDNRPLVNLFCQTCRLVGDRHIDVDGELMERVRHKFIKSSATSEQLQMLSEVVELNDKDHDALFGESLPIGIRFIGKL